MEWDIEGRHGDPMEDFVIRRLQGSACWSRRQCDKAEHMDRVRLGLLGGAYVEDPLRSRLDFEEGMHAAAVGTTRPRQLDPLLTSRSWSPRPRMPPCGKI